METGLYKERAATDVCVYPRDDVNTPHESTRLLDRDDRAAQFGCSRSSLVTRRNSAQVVLLCSECGLRYGASLSLFSLSLSLSPCLSLSLCLCICISVSSVFLPLYFLLSALFVLSTLPLSFFVCYAASAFPFFALAVSSFSPLPISFYRSYPLADSFTPFPSHPLTDCRPSVYLRRGRAATVDRGK